MSDYPIDQDYKNLKRDIDDTGKAVNEDVVVEPRYGDPFLSLPAAARTFVENGLLGATPFTTKSLLDASTLVDDSYAVVTNDTASDKNGFYQKKSGTWTFLKWNPTAQVKTQFAQQKVDLAHTFTNTDTIFAADTKNLFNYETVHVGMRPAANAIDLYGDASFSTSDYMRVEVGKRYKRDTKGTLFRNYHVYAYDSNKQPVSVEDGRFYWSTAFESTAMPTSVAYVRIIVPTSDYRSVMLLENAVDSTIYIPHYTVKKDVLLPALQSEKYLNHPYLLENTANLFNPDTFAKGYYGTNGAIYIASTTYYCSDFIAVEVGKKYKRANVDVNFYVYAYDSNKQPVAVDSAKVFWQTAFESTAIPTNVAYVKVLFQPANLLKVMFVENTVDTSTYIPHYVIKPRFLKNDLATTWDFKRFSNIDDLGVVEYQGFTADYNHIIFYGQSLSMGWESAEALTTSAKDGVYMVGDRVWINEGNNGSNVLNPLKATKSTNCGESPAVASTHVLKYLLERSNNQSQLIATNCGEGGKSIERLSKHSTNAENYYSTLFLNTLNKAKATVDALSKTIACPAIVYMQGEYNYSNLAGQGLTSATDATNDKAAYKALLKKLKDDMQADIMSAYSQSKPPLFFLYQTAGSYINLDNMAINMAQLEFAAENDDVILLNPTYAVPDYNGGHLSSNGYRWYGEYIAKQFFKTFIEFKKGEVVQAKSVQLNVAKDKVLIECAVPYPPLTIDNYLTEVATSSGFKVADSAGVLTVTNVKILNGTSIELSLNRVVGAGGFITYAGKDRRGTGNVRDSANWKSMYKYTDESAYAKQPYYTPKNTNNLPIYNSNYPMHNWLIAFYHAF